MEQGNATVVVKVELTPEEILALKSMAQDRMATTRVFGKFKNILLAVAGVVAAWILIVEEGGKWFVRNFGG